MEGGFPRVSPIRDDTARTVPQERDDLDDQSIRCPVCAELVGFCDGHYPEVDIEGAAILDEHELGDHRRCHPGGCDDIDWVPTAGACCRG